MKIPHYPPLKKGKFLRQLLIPLFEKEGPGEICIATQSRGAGEERGGDSEAVVVKSVFRSVSFGCGFAAVAALRLRSSLLRALRVLRAEV
jgi:hypothetical protein